jgi:glycosyltransferase involved in cell wall biosynthesis
MYKSATKTTGTEGTTSALPGCSALESKALPPQSLAGTGQRPRIALLCDLLEENWPSMDLVAEMLLQQLELTHSAEFSMARLCPPMRRHFGKLPLLGPRCHNADRLLNRFVDYPQSLRQYAAEFDLFHIIDHSYAQLAHGLPAARTVITCHDTDTFRCLLEPGREKRPRWFRAMTRRILEGFRQAAHVIAVSSATQEDLLRHGLFPPERITVVHNGVHPSCSPTADPAADAIAARLLPRDDGDTVWLLNVGSTMPRKRLDVLLRVFSAIRQELPEARLVRVGGSFTRAQHQLAVQLGVDDAIVKLPFLERGVLAAVYRRAALLVHTAEAEGFGLPIIEAMACGCPVVASDIPVLREVGGSAATYCPVADVNAWTDAVRALLQERRREQSAWELRRDGALVQAARFSWAENARQTARIYQDVLASA